jgi:acyl dehydratase
MKPTTPLFLEDLTVGQRFQSGTVTVDAARIKAFAAQFDPQPFHLDEAAARTSFFEGLVASGWHTAALTMRMVIDGELRIAGGSIGLGIEEIRWPRPVRPGDVLHVECEILEVRPSRSMPGHGIARVRTTTINQDGNPVMEHVARLLVPRRSEPNGTGSVP